MADRELDFKVMRNGDGVRMVERFGVEYYIEVNGSIKEQSSDMSFIRRVFNDNYNCKRTKGGNLLVTASGEPAHIY